MELDLVLTITKIFDQIITVAPVFLDLDPEFEIDLGIQHFSHSYLALLPIFFNMAPPLPMMMPLCESFHI